MSHVLLLPYGTAGSIYPFVWLGRLLKQRGHRVTLVTANRHAGTAAGAGLEFAPVENDELEQMLDNPGLWQGNAGPRLSYRHAGRSTEGYVQAVEKLIADGNAADLMLAPVICFGARLLREKLRIPLVTVHLYPMLLVSAHDPPALALPGFHLLRRLPLFVRQAVLAFPNPLDFFALPAVRAACARHGVRKPWSLWKQWCHSPDGVLALFPEWFAKPKPDWPHNLLQWDFPLEDMAQEEPLSPELDAFLKSGGPPVLFTPGTGHFHARDFFETAAGLVRQLGCRAVFLTRKPEQVPAGLPPTVFVESYAPFSLLLPRARAFVHHGGIGTAAQCLAAGIPQLVVAMSLDQPDNACHIERLGAGLGTCMRDFSVTQTLPLLRRCLQDEQIARSAAQLAGRMRQRRDPEPLLAWLESRLHRT